MVQQVLFVAGDSVVPLFERRISRVVEVSISLYLLDVVVPSWSCYWDEVVGC